MTRWAAGAAGREEGPALQAVGVLCPGAVRPVL